MRLEPLACLLVLSSLAVGCEQAPRSIDPVSSRLNLGAKALLYADEADTVFTMLSPRNGIGESEICFPTVGTPVVVVDDANPVDRHGQREVKVRIESGAYADRVGMVSRKNLRPDSGR